MGHTSSPWEIPDGKPSESESPKPKKWSESRGKDGGNAGHSRGTAKQGSLSSLGTKSSAASLNQPSQASGQYLTPPSSTSSVFDSPGKRSPSSSVSSIPPLCIHELEDTSLVLTKAHELEDTSKVALSARKLSPVDESYKMKSAYPSSLSIIATVDQHLAALEGEIRSLRQTIADNEHVVMNARRVVEAAQEAAANANRTISDRESQLEERNRLIADLRREVDDCRTYHVAPATPAKPPRDPLSRFNAASPDRTASPISGLATISTPSLPNLRGPSSTPTVKFAPKATIIPSSKSQTAISIATAMATASSKVSTVSTPTRPRTNPSPDRMVPPMMSGGLPSVDISSQSLPRPMIRVEPPRALKTKHKKGTLNFLRRKI